MEKHRLCGLIGLAQRAGKIQAGEGRAEDGIRRGESRLVILSEDASENTRKKFSNLCQYREVPLIRLWDRQTLGGCIGRDFAVVVSVTDPGFANRIIALCEM